MLLQIAAEEKHTEEQNRIFKKSLHLLTREYAGIIFIYIVLTNFTAEVLLRNLVTFHTLTTLYK